jgi:hypothetical protein
MLATRTEQRSSEGTEGRYRTSAVFGATFVALMTLLLIRNPGVFTLRIAERGDAAANGILVEQAKHFHLLVGNYSRIGFSHPGPAFLYVDALGEWLGYDVLGVLPSPYSGQWLAAMVLNAALVAAVLTVLWSWSRSWRALLWCAAVVLVFAGAHDQLLSSTWMPFVYFAPFLLFLTSAASVAAGRTRHAWLLTLSGGLLVHGHAEFLLLFVPAIALTVVAVLGYRRRRRGAPGPFVPRNWLAAGLVGGVLAVPMVLNLVLHWPGEYPKYLTYSGAHVSSHGIRADLRYLLGFWCRPSVVGVSLMVVLFAGVVLLARWQPGAQLRRFLATGVAIAGAATALFAVYVVKGIDQLSLYVGFFFWATPVLLLLLVVTGMEPLIRAAARGTYARVSAALPAAALAGGLVFAGSSGALPARPDRVTGIDRVIREVAAYGGGRPVVLRLDHDAWPTMTALLLAGERAGQRMCVNDLKWRFMVTGQFICRERELVEGALVDLAQPPGADTVTITFGGSVLFLPAGSA